MGFFEDFKGEDTLLIDVDAEGLRALIAWLRDVMTSDRKVLLSACSGVSLQAGLRVEVFRNRDDAGLLRTAETTFLWQRSEEGWTDIVEKLGAMGPWAGHQYIDWVIAALDLPRSRDLRSPLSPLCGLGATSFAWLAEPKASEGWWT